MQLTGLFVTAFIVGLTGAMTPGPLLTVAIAESTRRGFIAGPLLVLGHAILELALVIALLAGLAVYLGRESVTRVIAVLGGLFLLYMGVTILRDLYTGALSLEAFSGDNSGGLRFHPAVAGILVSLSNPYWLLWWATIGLTYLTVAMKASQAGVAVFYSGHILADLAWYSLVSLTVSAGRNILHPRVYQAVLALCGLFLLGLGGYFIYGVFIH